MPELWQAGCKRICQEKVSGASPDRLETAKCLKRLDKGGTLVMWRLGQLGRSISDLLRTVDQLDKSGVHFVCPKEKFDTSTAAEQLVFRFYAALAQFDKELVRERTMGGLSAARARGWLGGHSRLLTPQQAKVVKIMRHSRDHTRQEMATQFKVSVSTIVRFLRVSPTSVTEKKEVMCALSPVVSTMASRQIVMHCRCGKAKLLALGMCSNCHTLKWQDTGYFGGPREGVGT